MTFTIKLLLNPLLSEQQDSLAEKHNFRDMPIISSFAQLNEVIDPNLIEYIKITNPAVSVPIIHENKNSSFLSYLLPIPPAVIISGNGEQSIEFKASNTQLLESTEQVIVISYITLFMILLIINIVYYRLFKNIEKTLIKNF
jgi:hypothetical protein